MAFEKISQLPSFTSPVNLSSFFPMVDGGVTYQVTYSIITPVLRNSGAPSLTPNVPMLAYDDSTGLIRSYNLANTAWLPQHRAGTFTITTPATSVAVVLSPAFPSGFNNYVVLITQAAAPPIVAEFAATFLSDVSFTISVTGPPATSYLGYYLAIPIT